MVGIVHGWLLVCKKDEGEESVYEERPTHLVKGADKTPLPTIDRVLFVAEFY